MEISIAELRVAVEEKHKADLYALECAKIAMRKALRLRPVSRQYMFAALKGLLEGQDGNTH